MAQDFQNLQDLNQIHPKSGLDLSLKRYENEIRDQLSTGDLVFFSGKHWLSNLIRAKSKSGFSHVGMVIKFDEIDRTFLLESVIGNGVRLIPFSAIFKDYEGDLKPYNGRAILAKCDLINPENEQMLKIKSLEMLTRQYDNREYVRVFWRMIIGKARIYPDRQFTCSELIFECYRAIGIKLNYEHGDSISPGVIYRNDSISFFSNLI